MTGGDETLHAKSTLDIEDGKKFREIEKRIDEFFFTIFSNFWGDANFFQIFQKMETENQILPFFHK